MEGFPPCLSGYSCAHSTWEDEPGDQEPKANITLLHYELKVK